MALYELEYDEGIVLQSTTAMLGGATEEEFENEELMELIVTNKRIIYVVEISTGFFSKAKTEVRQVPISSIKVINGVPQVKQVNHDMWGHSVQVQFMHGIEYWTLEKKKIPEWVSEISRLLVGEPEPVLQTTIPTIEKATHEKEKKASVFGAFSGFTSVLKNVADTATQTVSTAIKQVSEETRSKLDVQEQPAMDTKSEDSTVVVQADELITTVKVEEPSVVVKKEELDIVATVEETPSIVQGAELPANSKVQEPPQAVQTTEQSVAQVAQSVPVNRFCCNCGTKLSEGAKFCQGCGTPVNGTPVVPSITKIEPASETKQPQAHQEERQQKYVGTIFKCPHCGGVVGETTAVCPDCGMRITGRTAVNSVQSFKEQLMEIEANRKKSVFGVLNVYAAADPVDKKKLTLIQNFPIPNTVDDILEFMMLAIANIDVSASKKTWANSSQGLQVLAIEMPRALSNAWVSKMQQAYQKAEILFPNDPAFPGIQRLYREKMKELKIKV